MGHKKVCGLDPEFGAIFMSNTQTKKECLRMMLFGLPSTHCEFVRKVKVGMLLFLFEYETRKLHGVFEAVSDGEVNIVPTAYRYRTGKSFPAQVRVRRIMHCQPLSEYEFSGVIKDNYYSSTKFNFGLSKHQVQDLFLLFKSRKDGESSKEGSREKKVRRQGSVSSRKVQSHQYDDEKIIVPQQDVVSQVGSECVLCSSSSSRSSKKQLSASSQSHQIQEIYQASSQSHQIQEIYHTTADSFMCCENETPLMDDGYPPPDDDLGDFIPLPDSSDEENDPAEEDVGEGESSQLFGTTSQRFTDKEKSWILSGSVDVAAAQAYNNNNNNNNNVSSNDAGIICHDEGNTLCTTASCSKNVVLCNDVRGGLYCDTGPQKRTSVFSRLNWRTEPQDNDIRASADKFVDEIMQEMQNKYDLGGGMLPQLKRQKCAAAAAELVDEDKQAIFHPNRNPDHHEGGSSVFQRLGDRVGGSR